jgi:hypothetical protein
LEIFGACILAENAKTPAAEILSYLRGLHRVTSIANIESQKYSGIEDESSESQRDRKLFHHGGGLRRIVHGSCRIYSVSALCAGWSPQI